MRPREPLTAATSVIQTYPPGRTVTGQGTSVLRDAGPALKPWPKGLSERRRPGCGARALPACRERHAAAPGQWPPGQAQPAFVLTCFAHAGPERKSELPPEALTSPCFNLEMDEGWVLQTCGIKTRVVCEHTQARRTGCRKQLPGPAGPCSTLPGERPGCLRQWPGSTDPGHPCRERRGPVGWCLQTL